MELPSSPNTEPATPLPASTRTRTGPAGPQRAVQGLLRLGITLFAFVFLLGFLLLGLAAASALVAWALIRGQKPAAGVFRDRFERARGRPHRASQADVVDAEVREVPEAEGR